MHRAARITGSLLIAAGVLTLAWAVLVWRWQDPFTALYTHWEQAKLARSLDRQIETFRPARHELSLAQVGLIRSAHRTAMAAFQIPAGLIAERFGERNLLALGTLVAGCAFVALGYVSGFWAILAVLFLAGAGSAVQHPLCSTIISRAFPQDGRRAALGTYNFSGDVGNREGQRAGFVLRDVVEKIPSDGTARRGAGDQFHAGR